VAGALCDFALGTDTAGSVRVPAAYCGLYGFRPSRGAIATEGVVPLAPSFDTVGFFARDAQTFTTVARVLFGDASSRAIERVIIAEDALALCDAGVSEVFEDALATLLHRLGVPAERAVIATPSFAAVREAFRRLQARDVWRTHGAWLTQAEPRFSSSVQARIDFARALAQGDDTEYERDVATCTELCDRLRELLVPGTLLFMPAVPGVAPRIGTPASELEITRARTLELTSFASLSGTPQLIVPLRELAGAPLALSFLAPAGSDAWLAQLSAVIERSLSA
jgi:amidase